MISAGSSSSSVARNCSSWAAVRAPSRGAVTPGASLHPQQRHLAGGQVEAVGSGRDRVDDGARAGLEVGLDEPREVLRCAPGAARTPGAVLAGEHAASDRRPGQQAHAEGADGRDHLHLGAAGQQ